MFLKTLCSWSVQGERSIANMILFRKSIPFGLNEQYNTYLWKHIHKTTSMQIFFSVRM